MKMISLDGTEVMECHKIEHKDNCILLRVTVMGAIPMAVILTPEEGRKALKMLNFKMILFLITFLFRKSKPVQAASPLGS